MAVKNNPPKNVTTPVSGVKTNKPIIKKDETNSGILNFLDNFFLRKGKLIFIISLIFTLLFSFLLFDVKVSDGGDDSAYIVRAFDFIHEFKYPGFQGALYPIFLSLFVAIFGINLPVLKFLSLVFIAMHLYLFYNAFKRNAPASVFFPVMILISINSSLLYFSSQTYSEAFFMFLQGLFFIYSFKFFINNDYKLIDIKADYKKFLILGFIIFLLALTRSIGYGCLFTMIGFFLLSKQWRSALFITASFFIFSLPYEILKKAIWSAKDLQFQDQAKVLFFKDAYDPNKGQEDLMGFLGRFIDNSNLYLSKHLFIFMGFKPDVTEITPFLTILVYLLFFVAIYFVFKKNKHLLFTGIYLSMMLGITFIVLQKNWDQGRIIICYFPLLLLFLFSGIYYALKTESLKKLQFLLPLAIVIIFFSSFQVTGPKVKEKKDILSKNLSGDMLYGLTPDWINFINMSKWAAKNIPADKQIASRKPDISFTYSNRKFYPMYKVPTLEKDTLLKRFKNDTAFCFAVKLGDLSTNKVLLQFHNLMKDFSIAFINGSTSDERDQTKETFMYGVYSITKKDEEKFTQLMTESKIEFITDLAGLLPKLIENRGKYLIYDPEELLGRLKKNNVHYVIMASLRQNPKVNSGQIIDTMNRYLYFIQLKYPGIIKEFHQIGQDEPARMIELNY